MVRVLKRNTVPKALNPKVHYFSYSLPPKRTSLFMKVCHVHSTYIGSYSHYVYGVLMTKTNIHKEIAATAFILNNNQFAISKTICVLPKGSSRKLKRLTSNANGRLA